MEILLASPSNEAKERTCTHVENHERDHEANIPPSM